MGSIGILGGTFDPVHIAHLMIAEHARSEFGLDRVFLMPTGKSPHKDESALTASAHRTAMISLAIQDNPFLALSRFEIDCEEVSYTYRTAERLNAQYPDDRFFYILGADSLKNFKYWRHPEIISQHFHLLAAVRDGEDRHMLSDLAADYRDWYGTDTDILSVPDFSISSTDIRERVRTGKSVRYLTPDPVIDYIMTHHLYRTK